MLFPLSPPRHVEPPLTQPSITGDETPLPPPGHPEEEAALKTYPWNDGPVKFDYGIYCRYVSPYSPYPPPPL